MAINDAAKDWGLKCLRYEIRDISPPRGARAAMEMQAEAERKKRAQVLESEGEAEAIIAKAQATAKGITMVSKAPKEHGGVEAASYRVAEQYIQAFSKIAKEDYNCTVDFISSPFLVRELSVNGTKGPLETLRLDLMDQTTSTYADADVVLFNTGHWWTHEKTARGFTKFDLLTPAVTRGLPVTQVIHSGTQSKFLV